MKSFYCPFCWRLIPDDAAVCVFCLNALTEWRDPRVIDSLLAALRSGETAHVVFAAEMLPRHRISQAVTTLLELAPSAEPQTKAAVILALRALDDQ